MKKKCILGIVLVFSFFLVACAKEDNSAIDSEVSREETKTSTMTIDNTEEKVDFITRLMAGHSFGETENQTNSIGENVPKFPEKQVFDNDNTRIMYDYSSKKMCSIYYTKNYLESDKNSGTVKLIKGFDGINDIISESNSILELFKVNLGEPDRIEFRSTDKRFFHATWYKDSVRIELFNSFKYSEYDEGEIKDSDLKFIGQFVKNEESGYYFEAKDGYVVNSADETKLDKFEKACIVENCKLEIRIEDDRFE